MKKFKVYYTTAGASPTMVYVDATSAEEAITKVKGWMQPRYAVSFKGWIGQ